MIDGVKHYSFATTTCLGAASSADVFHDLGSAAEFILRCATGNVVIVRYADDFLVLIPPPDSAPAHAQAMAASSTYATHWVFPSLNLRAQRLL